MKKKINIDVYPKRVLNLAKNASSSLNNSTRLFSACQTKGPKYYKNYMVSYYVFHKDTLEATRLEYAIE